MSMHLNVGPIVNGRLKLYLFGSRYWRGCAEDRRVVLRMRIAAQIQYISTMPRHCKKHIDALLLQEGSKLRTIFTPLFIQKNLPFLRRTTFIDHHHVLP